MRPILLLVSALLLFLMLLWPLAAVERAAVEKPVTNHAPTDADSDGDGLSDFQEIHKYATDPYRAATSAGIPDGQWNQRREHTYSVRAVIRLMPPYKLAAMNDDYQDVRVRSENPRYAELEVVCYPFNSNAEAIIPNPNWRTDYAGMKAYLEPGLTSNWDPAMRKDLLHELTQAGIEVDSLNDVQVVERVSRWLIRRSTSRPMFCTHFASFPEGKPTIFPGLEGAFAREKGNPQWSEQEQWAHELFGKEMFYNKVHGSCTSFAVYQTTALRALGIPTRLVLMIPAVDPSDPDQMALVRKNLADPRVRDTVEIALGNSGNSYTNHTMLEVYVGRRWRRLNYGVLGQNILDPAYLGLMIHVHTFRDLSDADLAPTWGARYALDSRDEVFAHRNPYRTVELKDHVGQYPPAIPTDERAHKELTITRAYWLSSSECPSAIKKTMPPRMHTDGAGHLFIHAQEWWPDAHGFHQYQNFMRRADPAMMFQAAGHPDVSGYVSLLTITDSSAKLHEMEITIPSEQYGQMVTGVDYTLRPLNKSEYQWKIAEGLVVQRPPTREHKQLTLTSLYWYNSPEAPLFIKSSIKGEDGMGHLFAHAEEWFEDSDGYYQYRRFIQKADKAFLLQAPGQPDVGARVVGSVDDSKNKIHDVALLIPADQYARMASGVDYTLHPVNSVPGYQWKVGEGLSIRRQPNTEERLRLLEQRYQLLEKRLRELEKKTGASPP